MKVYLLWTDGGYDPDTLVSVHATLEGARQVAQQHEHERAVEACAISTAQWAKEKRVTLAQTAPDRWRSNVTDHFVEACEVNDP